MEIKQYFLTRNPCYVAGVRFKPKGIIVHSTGANNPYLKRYIGPDDGILGENVLGNHWNRPEYDRACVHGFIGKDKDGVVRTYQTLPWDMRGWHAGSRVGNDQYIGFEICEDGLFNITYLKQCFDMAVDLCVHICKEMDIDPINIIGHYEGAKMGIASNHADPAHWFGRWGLGMDMLRMKVTEKLKEEDEEVKTKLVKYGDTVIPAIEDVPTDMGRTYVQLRDIAKAVGMTYKPLDGNSYSSGVQIIPLEKPVCNCEEQDELIRALKVLAKYMEV